MSNESAFAQWEGGCFACGKRDCECVAEAIRELYPLGGKLYWTFNECGGRRYRCLWQEGFDEVLRLEWLDGAKEASHVQSD